MTRCFLLVTVAGAGMARPVGALSWALPARRCCRRGAQQNRSSQGSSRSPGLSVPSPPVPLQSPSEGSAKQPVPELQKSPLWGRSVSEEARHKEGAAPPSRLQQLELPGTLRCPGKVQLLLTTLPKKRTTQHVLLRQFRPGPAGGSPPDSGASASPTCTGAAAAWSPAPTKGPGVQCQLELSPESPPEQRAPAPALAATEAAGPRGRTQVYFFTGVRCPDPNTPARSWTHDWSRTRQACKALARGEERRGESPANVLWNNAF